MTIPNPGSMEPLITIGNKYGPAMEIHDQAEADAYFEQCVEHSIRWGRSREEAENIERQNLGYYAGYYDTETRLRVEELFHCAHPIFGKVESGIPSIAQAYEMGRIRGMQEGSNDHS